MKADKADKSKKNNDDRGYSKQLKNILVGKGGKGEKDKDGGGESGEVTGPFQVVHQVALRF